jgi:sarcosine oxidase
LASPFERARPQPCRWNVLRSGLQPLRYIAACKGRAWVTVDSLLPAATSCDCYHSDYGEDSRRAFIPPHDQGSSHGDTRITREAIGEGREFVRLAIRSNQIWRELEAATGRSLLTSNGALVLASPRIAGNHHGSTSFVQTTIDIADEFGIVHEKLGCDDIRRRFPQFRLLGDEIGYFEPGAGFLRPEACIETQLTLAKQMGARIFSSEIVLALQQSKDGTVEVKTDKDTYFTAKAVLTAGPWIQNLLPTKYTRHFKVYRQVMCWFALEKNQERYAPSQFPVFIWIVGNRPRDMMYGFPAIDGPEGGLKVATEQYDATVNPDRVDRAVSDADVAAVYAEYIEPRFPDVSGRLLRAMTCLYTVTPGAKFVVDTLPNACNISFASACSGHGFKHSAALGEALALQALGQPAPIDLVAFSLKRF